MRTVLGIKDKQELQMFFYGLFTPKELEEIIGEAEIRRIFTLSNGRVVAGCLVTKGKVLRGSKVRLLREGKIIHQGRMSSLRRFKDNAKEVATNLECGIQLEDFNDFKAGDRFQIYQIKKIAKE